MSAPIDIDEMDCCKECATICHVDDLCHHGVGKCCVCQKCYDEMEEENQDDFTERMCEYCHKEFDLTDPHYYDNEKGICYCSKECYDKENDDGSDEISVASDIDDIDIYRYICKHCHLRFYDILETNIEKYGDWCRCSVSDIMK